MLCLSLGIQFLMLICENIAVGKEVSDGTILDRKKRTIIGQYPLCPLGCTSCSEMNGCVSCSPNFYMLLVRNGMRQTGVCTHNCPTGFYGVRRSNYSQCYRCSIDHCEACFSRTYCTRCTPPHVAYRGECIDGCPNGLYYANYSKDCREIVDCMVGPWSNWGSCRRNGQTCGYKYGIVSRARSVLEYPSPNGDHCPTLTENVCCRMTMRHCADLISNHSNLINMSRVLPHPNKTRRRKTNKTRRRKKNRKGRKQRKHRKGRKDRKKNRQRKGDKRKRRKKDKRNKIRKRNETKAWWKRICRRNVVFNDYLNAYPYI